MKHTLKGLLLNVLLLISVFGADVDSLAAGLNKEFTRLESCSESEKLTEVTKLMKRANHFKVSSQGILATKVYRWIIENSTEYYHLESCADGLRELQQYKDALEAYRKLFNVVTLTKSAEAYYQEKVEALESLIAKAE